MVSFFGTQCTCREIRGVVYTKFRGMYINRYIMYISASNFKKLQRVQNTLARVVLQLRRRDHITPALVQLQWLPVRHRVTFKIATIYHLQRNLLKFHRPSYLYQFVQLYTPSRNLRSLNQNLLVVNRARSAFAKRSFRHTCTSAAIWNSLSAKCRNCLGLTVETFRKHLKNHLFETAFMTTA